MRPETGNCSGRLTEFRDRGSAVSDHMASLRVYKAGVRVTNIPLISLSQRQGPKSTSFSIIYVLQGCTSLRGPTDSSCNSLKIPAELHHALTSLSAEDGEDRKKVNAGFE
jgi:hypothetical protein